MAELVDAQVSGTCAARRGGSSPLLGTNSSQQKAPVAAPFCLPTLPEGYRSPSEAARELRSLPGMKLRARRLLPPAWAHRRPGDRAVALLWVPPNRLRGRGGQSPPRFFTLRFGRSCRCRTMCQSATGRTACRPAGAGGQTRSAPDRIRREPGHRHWNCGLPVPSRRGSPGW